MQKIRYEVDPYNRLAVRGAGEKSGLPEFRKVIDGRFRIDKNNTLSYHVKAPLREAEVIPHQLKIRGRWSLTDDHDLLLTVEKTGRDTFGDGLVLQGEILDATESSLLFAVTTKTGEKRETTYALTLEGFWKADNFNRLSFHARREEGRHDILTFNGAWEIRDNYQIIYQYEKAGLIRKKRELHRLIFRGHWDIRDRFRISYSLGRDTASGFDFQTSGGIFKEDYIEYELGIRKTFEAEPVKRTVTLFGAWRLKKDTGLIFEIEYADKKTQAITFGAEAKLTDKDTVSFRLKDDTENKDLGINLELSRDILKGDGAAFLRLLKSGRESAVYAGAAWRW